MFRTVAGLKPEHRHTQESLQRSLRSVPEKEACTGASLQYASAKRHPTLSRALVVAFETEVGYLDITSLQFPVSATSKKSERAHSLDCLQSASKGKEEPVSAVSEPSEQSLLAEAAVWRALRRLRSLDQYELSGVTGLPLSIVKQATRSLVRTGEVAEQANGASIRYGLRATPRRLIR